MFNSVYRSLAKGIGNMGKKVSKTPTGYLTQVYTLAKDPKNDQFKKLVANVTTTPEEQAKFMLEVPEFVRYMDGLYQKGRNREMIKKRKTMLLPQAHTQPTDKQKTPAKAIA